MRRIPPTDQGLHSTLIVTQSHSNPVLGQVTLIPFPISHAAPLIVVHRGALHRERVRSTLNHRLPEVFAKAQTSNLNRPKNRLGMDRARPENPAAAGAKGPRSTSFPCRDGAFAVGAA